MVTPIDQSPEISLGQWAMLVAIVDEGGVHAAGRKLGRTHSAVSVAMRRLQDVLGLELLEVKGRRTVPTSAGLIIARRAREVLARARTLEQLATVLDAGWEPALTVAVDGLVPPQVLRDALCAFEAASAGTRVHLEHVVKSGAAVAATDQRYDLVLTATLPPRGTPHPLLRIPFAPVVAPEHPLAGVPLSAAELDDALQIVVADTGPAALEEQGWLRAERRWTVADFATARSLLRGGLAFALMPLPWIEEELGAGALVELDASRPRVELTVHLVTPKEHLGPAGQRLREAFVRVGTA